MQEQLDDEDADAGRVPRIFDCELSHDLVDSVAPGDSVHFSGVIKIMSAEEGKLEGHVLGCVVGSTDNCRALAKAE